MAESGLSLTRTGLQNAVCQYLGFGLSYSGITDSNKQTLVNRCIDDGLRAFYAPLPLPGERISHIWSFMQPEFTLGIDAATDSVDLPDDFGGFVGGVYLSSDDLSWDTVSVCGIGKVLQERQRDNSTTSGAPKYVAIQPLASDGTGGQRFSLQFWPSADGVYALKGTYYSNPYQLSATAVYPLGGQPHAETIREAVLAVAERDVNDTIGIHNQQFKERLMSSVSLDRRLTGPKSFGMNSDGGAGREPRLFRNGYVYYNNQIGD